MKKLLLACCLLSLSLAHGNSFECKSGNTSFKLNHKKKTLNLILDGEKLETRIIVRSSPGLIESVPSYWQNEFSLDNGDIAFIEQKTGEDVFTFKYFSNSKKVVQINNCVSKK